MEAVEIPLVADNQTLPPQLTVRFISCLSSGAESIGFWILLTAMVPPLSQAFRWITRLICWRSYRYIGISGFRWWYSSDGGER